MTAEPPHKDYHVPVMLQECIAGLSIVPDGVYVDVTFGGGGHSLAILSQLSEKGKLFAFDQDPDAVKNARAIDHPGFELVQANFRHLKRYLRFHGQPMVDGILADLGVSSHQINEGTRGFSTRFEGDLDMRMDKAGKLTAADILTTYSQDELQRVFGKYGEVRNARTLAARVVSGREGGAIGTSEVFKKLISDLTPRGKENRYLAQVYQALRIEVNDEMGALHDLLQQSAEVLRPSGRLVVMAYHSLEDRPVKNFIREGIVEGQAEKDLYGNVSRPFEPVSRGTVTAGPEELSRNPRARSAKLRVAERNNAEFKV